MVQANSCLIALRAILERISTAGESENRFVKLNVSTKGMRIIDKLGIEKVMEIIKEKEGN